jgi:hypothetical protein
MAEPMALVQAPHPVVNELVRLGVRHYHGRATRGTEQDAPAVK